MLTVVNLATGRVRWSRAGVRVPAPVVVGGVVIAAVQWSDGGSTGSVSGYDARTGALLWTRADLTSQPQLAVAAGVSSCVQRRRWTPGATGLPG